MLLVSLAIDDQDSIAGTWLKVDVPERRVGMDNRHDAQAIELRPFPASFADGPKEHPFLSGQVHFGVGEAGPGVNVARADFEIIAGDGWCLVPGK